MAKNSLTQGLKQTTKFAPSQIQFMKLLQLPTLFLEQRLKEELEKNPVLEEGENIDHERLEDIVRQEDEGESTSSYMSDEYEYKRIRRRNNEARVEAGDIYSSGTTLYEDLLSQLYMTDLSADDMLIGEQIIGNIDEHGYLTRSTDAIADDFLFYRSKEVSTQQIDKVLSVIQTFEPAGIGARDLRECLLLQIERRKDKADDTTLQILNSETYFNMFKNKQYQPLMQKLLIDKPTLDKSIKYISSLNPKPAYSNSKTIHENLYIVPDFLVWNNNGKVEFSLNKVREHSLFISSYYSDLLNKTMKKENKTQSDKDTITFIKSNMDSANEFISALSRRDDTLCKVMAAIIKYQYSYFLEGDIDKLKPMRLEDIAKMTDNDISTVSRVTMKKYAQTHFGTFLLKDFFSNAMADNSGQIVSADTIKSKLKQLIDNEDKHKPLTDDRLVVILEKEGYKLARRTVAKYRAAMDIPVARLRKVL
ncbi:MAG: RNA polymerase factor sigma-54 [Bacteroidales bacterium]|nr:RNA polymerase factor sigma-54 [Bacteroidales bacterium]MBQ9311911.1 RNA polymerase factor sigma-54 [Bacteroidales bacterium]